MIQTILLAAAGGAVGLLVGVLGRLFTLPYVLKQQKARGMSETRLPPFGWKVTDLTVAMYRYYIPAFFCVIFAVLAIRWFGSSE